MCSRKFTEQKIGGKLVESLRIEGLGKLAQEYVELGLDLVTKDGILKDIPVVVWNSRDAPYFK